MITFYLYEMNYRQFAELIHLIKYIDTIYLRYTYMTVDLHKLKNTYEF